MQTQVNYEELVDKLGYVNGCMATGVAAIRTECASLSYKLNEIGLQSMASGIIDSRFGEIISYMNQAHDYITSLINWVNNAVVKGYQSADQRISSNFERALQGRTAESNGYLTKSVYESISPDADQNAKDYLFNYFNENDGK